MAQSTSCQTVGFEVRDKGPRKPTFGKRTGGWEGSYSVALLSGTERSGVELTMHSDPWVVGWEDVFNR